MGGIPTARQDFAIGNPNLAKKSNTPPSGQPPAP
jgi:hypothetical protein